mgnify:CR=1 FL=1
MESDAGRDANKIEGSTPSRSTYKCPFGGMADTRVLEALTFKCKSSSLLGGTKNNLKIIK